MDLRTGKHNTSTAWGEAGLSRTGAVDAGGPLPLGLLLLSLLLSLFAFALNPKGDHKSKKV